MNVKSGAKRIISLLAVFLFVVSNIAAQKSSHSVEGKIVSNENLAIEFATETESLGIPLLPGYSRSIARFAEQNNNEEIHATFLHFCKGAEKVETGELEQLLSAGTFPVLALPTTGSPTANLSH